MSRPFQPLLLLVLLAALLIGSGCSRSVAGAPAADPAPAPTEGPGSDPVPWVGRICGAVLSFATPATKKPDFAATADLPAVRATVSAYLSAVATGAQQGKEQLRTLGKAPVDGGDAAAGRIRDGLDAMEQAFTGSRTTIDAADLANPDAFIAQLAQMETTLNALKSPDPFGEFAGLPRLQRATQDAAECRQLSTLAGATPR